MNTHPSNLLPVRPVLFAASVCWLSFGTGELLAQQYQYPPGYAPPRYTQPQAAYSNPSRPGVTDRIRSTGQNIGNFLKRSFYGEPASPVQQPAYYAQNRNSYRAPAGSTSTRSSQGRYNLDAPPVKAPATTGFQAPRSKDVPKYTPAPSTKKSTTSTTKPSTTNRSSSSTSSKKYTPSKPSSFSKPVPKRTEDAPPSVPYEPTPPQPPTFPGEPAPTMPQPSQIESEPAPTIEAKMKDTHYPLPGGITVPPSEPSPPPMVETKSTVGSSSTAASSSNSFMVGKKTSKPGRVVSPYAPYNELDITGLPSGSLALDPTTQKVFQVP